jgi:hypothetical protein
MGIILIQAALTSIKDFVRSRFGTVNVHDLHNPRFLKVHATESLSLPNFDGYKPIANKQE